MNVPSQPTDSTTVSAPTASWTDLARHLAQVQRIGPRTTVSITMNGLEAEPAVAAVVAEVYRRGGLPQVQLASEHFDRLALEHADPGVLGRPGPVEVFGMQWADVHLAFREMIPPAADASAIATDRLVAHRRAKGQVSTLRWQQTRWTIVRVPTRAWAQMIGTRYEDLLAEFFAGCLGDWAARRRPWDALAERLNRSHEVYITAPDTDLRLRVDDRTWVVFAGEENLPDGEIATAPVDDSAEGHISFPGTFWFGGVAVRDLQLDFTAGAVSAIQAADGADFVKALLDTDPGARRIGELAFGTNAGMRTMTGDLFFDEKVLGSVHLALGRAYPQCGGINESALHMDIVKDLRRGPGAPGGSLLVDGAELIRDGHPVGGWTDTSEGEKG